MNEDGIHLGIIPDGIRRWAKKNRIINHKSKRAKDFFLNSKIFRYILDKHFEVGVLSIWALSTENLRRPKVDKERVFEILKHGMKELFFHPKIYENQIKVNVVGSRWKEIPLDVKEIAQEVVSRTADHKGRICNLCIGYGGKEEILSAVLETGKWFRENSTKEEMKYNKVFERSLLIPESLDIVIRTGGEKRLSGFMLYQIGYAELFFTDTLWPDLTIEELDKIIRDFSKRDRRFGR